MGMDFEKYLITTLMTKLTLFSICSVLSTALTTEHNVVCPTITGSILERSKLSHK